MRNTPGPWENDDNRAGFITARGGPDICEVFGESERAEECDFNQSLIAAAPELLAVCQAMAGDLQALLDGDDFSGMSDAEMFGVMLRSLNAAIAKAEGRSE
jgi:hypothetical protein